MELSEPLVCPPLDGYPFNRRVTPGKSERLRKRQEPESPNLFGETVNQPQIQDDTNANQNRLSPPPTHTTLMFLYLNQPENE